MIRIALALMLGSAPAIAQETYVARLPSDIRIEYTECKIWDGVLGISIVYMPGNRPAGYEMMTERCYQMGGMIDMDTIIYYQQMGVMMDVATK